MAAETDPRIGTKIAGYRIAALIGHGGTGSVYLAYGRAPVRKVALKLIIPEPDASLREHFLRESELVAALNHPNIVPIFEAGEVDGLLYVAMGYVEGSDLNKLLDRAGRLEPERAVSILAQSAEALDAARWGEGLVHGRLKPNDVLLATEAGNSSREHVFLTGFGLSWEPPRGAKSAEARERLGTIDYLAPEQIEEKSINPRTDVYALGCLLFQCLTGEPPFMGDSPNALLKAHRHEQPPSARQRHPDLPAGVDRVFQKAMAKWPEERYSTCGELAAAARAVLVSEPTRSEPRPRHERPVVPVDLLLGPESALMAPPAPSHETNGQPPEAPDPLPRRLWERRRGSLSTIGLILLLAALAAGAVWLTRGDSGDVSIGIERLRGAQAPEEIAVEAEETAETAPSETGFLDADIGSAVWIPPDGKTWNEQDQAAVVSNSHSIRDELSVSQLTGFLDQASELDRKFDALGNPDDLLAAQVRTFARLYRGIFERAIEDQPEATDSEHLAVAWSEALRGLELRADRLDLILEEKAEGSSTTRNTRIDENTEETLRASERMLAALIAYEQEGTDEVAPDAAGSREESANEQTEHGSQPSVPLAAGSVIRIDPQTNRLTAEIEKLDSASDFIAVAAGDGAVWAIDREGSSYIRILMKIDPQTNTAVRTELHGPQSGVARARTNIAIGEGSVWFWEPGGPGNDDVLVTHDAETGGGFRRFGLGLSDVTAIAVGRGAVWLTSAGSAGDAALRINPETGEIVTAIELSDEPIALAVGQGGIWVLSRGNPGSVSRIDPATNELVERIELPGPVTDHSAISAGAGAVWATAASEASVLRIDPATNQVTAAIATEEGPVGIDVGNGTVWVVNHRVGSEHSATVSRIDPATNKVTTTIDLRGACGCSVAVGAGGVWAT